MSGVGIRIVHNRKPSGRCRPGRCGWAGLFVEARPFTSRETEAMTQTEAAAPVVRSERRDDVRVLTIANPPINALGMRVAAGLLDEIEAAESDTGCRAIVIAGGGGFFSGGADINEFLQPRPPGAKSVRHVIARIERSMKTYVAAIDGQALGGGCELALGCDYRVASPKSKIGLPEIKLGLIPGAGGTQRLPRLIGAQGALEMMLKGDPISASDAKLKGLVDEIVDGDVVVAAIAAAQRALAGKKKRRASEMTAFALPFMVAAAHQMVPAEGNGGLAAHTLVDAVEVATQLPFARGIARESRYFDELVRSQPAQALMHVFFAERELAKIPGLAAATPQEVRKAAVIGAGTMGTGIAITFANAGIPVAVIDVKPEQVERGKQHIAGVFSAAVAKGRMSDDEAKRRSGLISFAGDYAAIADVDLVVEAVFENMEIKKQVFAALDKAIKPEAILATNTSTLDIDAMAHATTRPSRVVGMHFFSPANVMKLLEVVRGADSSPETLASAMRAGKALRKVGVLSGNAFGFIGNRMFFDYAREAISLAEEGSTPAHIDAVMRAFGFAMGPYQTFDLSGVDVFWRIEQERPPEVGRRSTIVTRLYELGRHGQKTGAGFYTYADGKRDAIVDPQIETLIADEAKKAGVVRRAISDDEIRQRCVYALVNAGANLLDRKIALRAGDIDIVWIYGYGFPPHVGGPMWYADTVGTRTVYDAVVDFRQRFGPVWEPSPLLASLAKSNGTFNAQRRAVEERAS